jgi:hypothetical protein
MAPDEDSTPNSAPQDPKKAIFFCSLSFSESNEMRYISVFFLGGDLSIYIYISLHTFLSFGMVVGYCSFSSSKSKSTLGWSGPFRAPRWRYGQHPSNIEILSHVGARELRAGELPLWWEKSPGSHF